MIQIKGLNVGAFTQLIARATHVSACFKALEIGALPVETIEGLMLATETGILVQLAIGTLNKEEIAELRQKIVGWSLEAADKMETNGTAEEIRQYYAKAIGEFNKTHDNSDENNMN